MDAIVGDIARDDGVQVRDVDDRLLAGGGRVTATVAPNCVAGRMAACHAQAGRAALVSAGGQDPVELAAGADAELGEDLAQVVLDRAR